MRLGPRAGAESGACGQARTESQPPVIPDAPRGAIRDLPHPQRLRRVPALRYAPAGITQPGRIGIARYDFIAVYIMTSRRDGPLYTGVTSDLLARIHLHREGRIPGFTAKYKCRLLVWYEQHAFMAEAIAREKRVKRWLRAWKIELIETANPTWRDLYLELV